MLKLCLFYTILLNCNPKEKVRAGICTIYCDTLIFEKKSKIFISNLQFITFIIDHLTASISDVFGHLLSYWIEKKSFKKCNAGHFDIGIWRRISNQGPLPYVTLHPCTRLKLFARWAKNLRNTFVTQSALSTTTIRFKQILHPLFENGPFGRIWNILCENQSRTDAMELIESSKGAILLKSRWNSNLKRGSYPPTSHPTSHPQKRFISTPPLGRRHHCTKSFSGLQRPTTSLSLFPAYPDIYS